jgi:hypothetical protein
LLLYHFNQFLWIKLQGNLNLISLKGIVIPADWDHNGNIISVAIATDGEQEYFIDTSQNVTNMIALLRQEVEITGTIRHTGEKKFIRVVSCNINEERTLKM